MDTPFTDEGAAQGHTRMRGFSPPGPPGRAAQRLRSHLEAAYAITVTAMTELAAGVWRVGRAGGPDWAARWFPATAG
jgi:hypothetical protein